MCVFQVYEVNSDYFVLNLNDNEFVAIKLLFSSFWCIFYNNIDVGFMSCKVFLDLGVSMMSSCSDHVIVGDVRTSVPPDLHKFNAFNATGRTISLGMGSSTLL